MREVRFPVTSSFTPSAQEAGGSVCENPACTAGTRLCIQPGQPDAAAAAGQGFQEHPALD